jgi:hypothetical protein
MSVKEDLRAVRQLLSDPERWIKGAYHRPSVYDGKESYCLRGAVDHVVGYCSGEHWIRIRRLMDVSISRIRKNHIGGMVAFNDAPETTHEDVLAVLDLAIKEAE